MMVKPFGDSVAALKPGEIPNFVQSHFGFHIIQPNTWESNQGQIPHQAGESTLQNRKSTLFRKAKAGLKFQSRKKPSS